MPDKLFKPTALYKVLGAHQESCHGGTGRWTRGKRRSVKGTLVPCSNGIHLCTGNDLLHWLKDTIWEVRASTEHIRDTNKTVVRWAYLVRKTPWNSQIARLFAADCAERVVHLNPDDPRVPAAILAARQYAFGLIGAAARDAARDAAWAAAGDAAGDAARAAAWAAAGDAARAAAWAAAGDAEKTWQTQRLFQYLNKQVNLVAIKKSLRQ